MTLERDHVTASPPGMARGNRYRSTFSRRPAMAARFTQGELAALCIVGDEVRHHGVCGLHIDAIAARAGTCRSTVKNALRSARFAATTPSGATRSLLV
jgi:hypothetical protein